MTAVLLWCTDSRGNVLISVAFPRQPTLSSVSQTANLQTAFIINHRIILGLYPNDVGLESHNRICNCLHNAQQVRCQALIWGTNFAWGFCSTESVLKMSKHPAEAIAKKTSKWGGCINKCDCIVVLCVLCWPCGVLLSTFGPHSCQEQVFEALWPVLECVSALCHIWPLTKTSAATQDNQSPTVDLWSAL